MEIKIQVRGLTLTATQSEFVERRLQYALGRFSSQIRTVHATLSDINGPRGGQDVLCRVKVVLRKTGEVIVGDTDVSPEAAIANVADRAARSLSRLLDRERDRQGLSMSGLTHRDP